MRLYMYQSDECSVLNLTLLAYFYKSDKYSVLNLNSLCYFSVNLISTVY